MSSLSFTIIVIALIVFCIYVLLRLTSRFTAWVDGLPPLEHFIPLERRLVRISAVIFGVICWSALFDYFATGNNWRIFRSDPNVAISTLGGGQANLLVGLSAAKKKEDDLKALDLEAQHAGLRKTSAEFAALAKKIGMIPLDKIVDSTLLDEKLPIFIQSNAGLIPAINLKEKISSKAQPLWRGWFAKMRGVDGETSNLEASLWCGFDLSLGAPKRFCHIGIPMPVFVRLFLEGETDNEITYSAPLIYMRLDAEGAKIIDIKPTHRTYERKQNLQSQEVSFTVQGESEQLDWDSLSGEWLNFTMQSNSTHHIRSHRILWSKREVRGQDKFLFAGEGEPGFTSIMRKIDRPKLYDLAHDFLKPDAKKRVNSEMRDWIITHLAAGAVLAQRKTHSELCKTIAKKQKRYLDRMNEPYKNIQVARGTNRQVVTINDKECSSKILPMLLFRTWAGLEGGAG